MGGNHADTRSPGARISPGDVIPPSLVYRKGTGPHATEKVPQPEDATRETIKLRRISPRDPRSHSKVTQSTASSLDRARCCFVVAHLRTY